MNKDLFLGALKRRTPKLYFIISINVDKIRYNFYLRTANK